MAISGICFVFYLMWIGSSASVPTKSDSTPNSAIPTSHSRQVAMPRILKTEDYHTDESVRQNSMHRPPGVAMHFNPNWLNDGHSFDGGWFGFPPLIQRSTRNMHLGHSNRLRDAQMLGESTIMFPTTQFFPNPSFYFDEAAPFAHHFNDLHSQGSIPYPEHLSNGRFGMFGNPMSGGYLNTNEHSPHQKRQQNGHNHQYQNFNYQRGDGNLQRTSSSSTPMMIKIIPLKLSTIDISNALKSMSWIPIPINLLNRNNNNQNLHKDSSQQVYSDKRQNVFDEDESDLPPPSSHVATPPLGITYAEGQRSERFARYPPPK